MPIFNFLKVKSIGDPIDVWGTILHLTTGGNCCEPGQRYPAIFVNIGEESIRIVEGFYYEFQIFHIYIQEPENNFFCCTQKLFLGPN